MARKPTTLKAIKAPEELSLQEKEEAELVALRNKVADLENLLQNPSEEEEYEDEVPDNFYSEDEDKDYYPKYRDRDFEKPTKEVSKPVTILSQLQAVLKWIFDMVFGFCAIVTCAILGIIICFIPIGAFEAFSVYLLRFMGVHL